MSKTEQTQQDDACPHCTKAGLPILPLRYAIARNDETVPHKAPRVEAPFGAEATDVTLPHGSAAYTLRTLREGYLYTFNEVRGEWTAYEVDEYGTLFEFDIRDQSPPPNDGDELRAVCSRHGNPDIGQCIIVADAHRAGALWLGVSDSAWTRDVWDKHKQQAYREQHMRRIDVGAWVRANGAQSQPHLDALSVLGTHVGEYAMHRGTDRGGVDETPGQRAARDKRNAARAARVEQARREGREPAEADLAHEVAEVTVTAVRTHAFDVSLAPFVDKSGTLDDFIEEANSAGERGRHLAGSSGPYPPLMVALNDPVGIAMDLASLMRERLKAFMARDDIKRPLAVSTLVGSLEEAVRHNAELEAVKSAREAAVRRMEFWLPENGPNYDARGRLLNPESVLVEHDDRMQRDRAYRDDWNRRTRDAADQAALELTGPQLQDASDAAWTKYRDKLQSGQPERWRRDVYQPAMQAFDTSVIVPLAQAHLAWLKSPKMSGHMRCTHDENDPASGLAYTDTVLLCLQDTQAIGVNAAQYAEWLGASTVEDDNLLLRALALNQKPLVELLNTGGGLRLDDVAKVPWSLLLEGYGNALRELPASQQSTPARLLMAVAGPAMTALDGALNRGLGPLVIGLGMIARQPVVHTQVRGRLSDAIDDLVERMVRANPALGALDRDRLRTRMRNQSAGQRQVTPARGPGTRGLNDIQIVVDQLAVGQIDSSMTPREQLRRAGQSVMTFEQWQRSRYSRWRTLTDGINGGIVGVLLSVWSMKALAKELDQSTAANRTEHGWRYSAAVLGVVGAVSEGLHTALENGRRAGSRLATRIDQFWSRFLRGMGRALGFAAAVIFAFWDAVNAFGSFRRGEVGIGVLYIVSGVSSVVAFAALAGWFGATIVGLSATGVGIVLAAIAIVVALAIAWLKDDKLEAWMRRCWFGTAGNGRFGTQEEEMAELDAMLQAG